MPKVQAYLHDIHPTAGQTSNPASGGQIGPGVPGVGRTWYVPGVYMTMHKQQLLRLLERAQYREKLPTEADMWPWASLVIALAMTLIANDPRDFLLPPTIWQGAELVGTAAAAYKTLTVWRRVQATKAERAKSPETMFQEILKEAQEEEKALADAFAANRSASGTGVTPK